MARLVVLNGPPGIGKSTLSARYADQHPGTLDLDIDRLHVLIGGWRGLGGRIHDVLRPIALAMASAHLAAGRDVVVPQHLGSAEDVDAFDRIAQANGAAFSEVVLLDDRAAALERYRRRPDEDGWARFSRQLVDGGGDADLLSDLYDQVVRLIGARPGTRVVRSREGAIDETYAALLAVIDEVPAP